MDVIYALATAAGRAGIAVVRVSGSGARSCIEPFTGRLPAAGRSLRFLRDADRGVLDHALVLTFADGASFTGEEMVELHLHGSTAVVRAVLALLGGIQGLRGAAPGEFTQRAMQNGRLDLSQVEGLADLIDAETEAQRRQALRLFSGALGVKAADWRGRLVRAIALIEATIDFSDEDVPADVAPEVGLLLGELIQELRSESHGVGVAERIRDGFEVAIIGPPNAGKSTLLNRFAGRDVALTSELAGTTRDVLEVRLDLGGLPVTLLDTAGLGEAQGSLDALGMERARARATGADLRIHLLPLGTDAVLTVVPGDIVVGAKADLGQGAGLGVSGLTGMGYDELVQVLAARLSDLGSGGGIALNARHREAMMEAAHHLDAAAELLAVDLESLEVVAEEVRSAMRKIDRLVGSVDAEDILGEIFSRFCIGK